MSDKEASLEKDLNVLRGQIELSETRKGILLKRKELCTDQKELKEIEKELKRIDLLLKKHRETEAKVLKVIKEIAG